MNSRIVTSKFNNRHLWLMLLPFLLVACQSYKKVPYFQDVDVVNQAKQQERLYDARIMPKDLLTSSMPSGIWPSSSPASE